MANIIRKLRPQRGWTQDQLAEFAGINVRSVQRIERGADASLETLKAMAAVFEVDLASLQNGAALMETLSSIAQDEKEASEYVKGVREFYSHVFLYAVFAIVFPSAFGGKFGFDHQKVQMMMLALAGWGVVVAIHGLVAYEVIRFLGPKWERALIERRIGRSL